MENKNTLLKEYAELIRSEKEIKKQIAEKREEILAVGQEMEDEYAHASYRTGEEWSFQSEKHTEAELKLKEAKANLSDLEKEMKQSGEAVLLGVTKTLVITVKK